MTHFDYTRTGGIWTGSMDLLAAEMADLDSKTKRALNADEGGTWAPTTTITIGGQGVTITGTSILDDCQSIELTDGFLNVYSGAQVQILTGGVLEAQSGATVDLQAGSTTTLASGASFLVSSGGVVDFASGADVDINCNVEVESGAAMIYRSGSQHIANSGSSTTIQTGATLTLQSGATVNVAANVTQTGKITHSGAGGRVAKRTLHVVNTSQTVGVDDADYVLIDAIDGGTYVLTLDDSPLPDEGESINIRLRELNDSSVTVKDDSTGLTIYNFGAALPDSSGGFEAVWLGGRWRVFGGIEACYTSES